MTKQIVYRIEHAVKRTGPYRSDELTVEEICDRHNMSIRHPSGNREFGWDIQNKSEWRFGFVDLEQYHAWFEDFPALLKERGFVLCKYVVKAKKYILKGKHQVIFDPEYAKLVSEHCPVTIEPLAA